MYNNDYRKSREKEIEFEAYIKSKYNLLTENSSASGYAPHWDISTTATSKNNKVTKFEIKYNSNYNQNTVVIENCRIIDEMRIPCGLTLTQADYYVLAFPEDYNWYLIKVDVLKELVADTKNHKKKIVWDKANYQLHIFDKDFFLSHCKAI